MGGLDTFDPLDPNVAAWWKVQSRRALPRRARPRRLRHEGRFRRPRRPSTYGRTHADAANVVARALKPHGGLLFYRGFVYDHHMDWNNPKNDRARAAYDNFKRLDGKFDDNVIIQIKNGPIDFQVREPASPLFGALEKTNQAIELQITQEYFGQARHTVFLVPHVEGDARFRSCRCRAESPRRRQDLPASHRRIRRRRERGPGRQLARQSSLAGESLWLRPPGLESGSHRARNRRRMDAPHLRQRSAKSIATIDAMQLNSWRTYENYTGPLGLQTLTDITGNHYGVAVEASERNGWGQWHRADEKGVGMDRTVATGTGFIGQYPARGREPVRIARDLPRRSAAVSCITFPTPYSCIPARP